MKAPETIPDFVAHLPRHAGWPVPFFTAYSGGVPDFRAHSITTHNLAMEKRACGVCGAELGYWIAFVMGPGELKQRITFMPAMHERCARWAMEVCPFIAMEHRVHTEASDRNRHLPGVTVSKPTHLAFVQTRSYETILGHQHNYLYAKIGAPTRVEWYSYADGRLVRGEAPRG